MHYLPPKFIVEQYIKDALREDIGNGDLTVDCLVPADMKMKAIVNSRQDGILSGIEVLKMVFQNLDNEVKVKELLKDGGIIKPGQDIAIIEGPARAILTGERLALNFIQRMSAIATTTAKYQEAAKPYRARILDTRKTTPNFRIFEKYSVKVGGGAPHRFGLYDCVMIKDNHIALVGSITKAVEKIRENVSHTIKIEVETDTFEQVKEAVECKADMIMLDNMTVEQMKECVEYIDGRALTEASGGVTLKSVHNIASSGVDYISTSATIAKAGALDIGLDM